MNTDKQNLDQDNLLSSASMELVSLDAWINQHLEQREKVLQPNNPFVWHQPSANDLISSTNLDLSNEDLDTPINYTKE